MKKSVKKFWPAKRNYLKIQWTVPWLLRNTNEDLKIIWDTVTSTISIIVANK